MRLNGWHAAERGEVFDFRMPKTWQEGHMLWTQTHIAQPSRTSSAPDSSSASPQT